MKLTPIDLSKANEHDHPDINTRSWFLAEIRHDEDAESIFLVGKFSKQWYGFNFDCDDDRFGCGLQFDEPGQNCSSWRKLWKVKGANSRQEILAKLMRPAIKRLSE